MMSYKRRIYASLIAAISLIATASQAEEKVNDADIIATVNGEPITIADRTSVSKQMLARGQPADNARITDELVNLELMKQEALKRGLEKDEEVMAQLDLLNTRVLANAAITALSKEVEITEEEIENEYKQQIAKLDLKEFKASHILLKDEETAKGVIEEVAGGADFAEVAKAKSTGPSGPNGGDLGWFNAKSMVAEFSDAVAAMKPGDVSKEPVKTQFGYHVIKLDETRESEAPKLEQVRGEIQGILTQTKLSAKIDELRKAAKIEIKESAN